jgi:hypothetical protein
MIQEEEDMRNNATRLQTTDTHQIVIVPFCTIGYRSAQFALSLREELLTSAQLKSPSSPVNKPIIQTTINADDPFLFVLELKEPYNGKARKRTTIQIYNGGGVVPFAWEMKGCLSDKKLHFVVPPKRIEGVEVDENFEQQREETQTRTNKVHVFGTAWNELPEGFDGIIFHPLGSAITASGCVCL